MGCRRKTLVAIFLFALFLALTGPLYAGGSQEDAISTAKQMIVEKKYDPALAILAEVIKSDSSRFDEAYALVQQIQIIKGDYNQYLEDLYKILTSDPGNYEKALAAINKMIALDPNPSERNRQKIEDLRILAKITRDRNEKDKLMAKALAQIQAKEYMAAIDTYLSGFDMQADDFLIGTQTKEFKSSVLDLVKTIRASTDVYKSENSNLMPSLDKFSKDIQEGEAGLDRVAKALPVFSRQFLVSINQAVQIEKYASQSVSLRGRSDKEYSYTNDKRNYNYNEYVRFIQEFMNGPPGKTGQGIAYAARTLIDSEYADTLARLQDLYQTRKQGVADLIAAKDNGNLPAAFSAVALSGNILLRAHGLKGSIDLGDKPTFPDLTGKLAAPFRKVPAGILLELHAYRELEFDLKQKQILEGLTLRTTDSVWSDALIALDNIKQSYDLWAKETKEVQDSGLVDKPSVDKSRAVFVPTMSAVQDGLLSLAQNRFSAIAKRQLEAVRTPFAASAAEEKQGLEQLNGITPTTAQAAAKEALYRYPATALAIFSGLRQKYTEYLKNLDGLDKSISEGRVEVREYAPVQVSAKDSKNLRDEIMKALSRLDIQIAKAQANIKNAQERFQKAGEDVAKADAAVSNNRLDVDTADAAFESASNLYFQSFDLSYNQEQRAIVDSTLKTLRGKIEAAREALFIKLKNEAIDKTVASFEKEQYQAANSSITQAQKYYEKTSDVQKAIAEGKTLSDVPDQVISYWMTRIQAATSLSNERVILESDPSFFTLMNYLNIAQLNLSKALRMLKSASGADVKPLLTDAKGNIDNILLVKPNNKDAKLLRLQVDRIADPANFDLLYPNRVREMVDQASKPAADVGALTDLYALKEIKPAINSPEIRKAIADLQQATEKLEIKLGLRDSPLTAAQKAEARQLISQATPLVRSTRQADLRQAVALLTRALRLDPTNRQAAALLDLARAKIVGTPDSLNFEEQQQFNKAVELLNANLAGNASTIASALLKDHPTYPPLLKLIQKINQSLGQ